MTLSKNEQEQLTRIHKEYDADRLGAMSSFRQLVDLVYHSGDLALKEIREWDNEDEATVRES